jgi:Na+/glutamate symporter
MSLAASPSLLLSSAPIFTTCMVGHIGGQNILNLEQFYIKLDRDIGIQLGTVSICYLRHRGKSNHRRNRLNKYFRHC